RRPPSRCAAPHPEPAREAQRHGQYPPGRTVHHPL
ncbi:uncharacterized protein METZ01_LOCUS268882, partial [marine metagenome]